MHISNPLSAKYPVLQLS